MEINLFKRQIPITRKALTMVILIPLAAIVLGGVGVFAMRGEGGVLVQKGDIPAASASAHEETGKKAMNGLAATQPAIQAPAREKIRVYVVGCVRREGIVTVDRGEILDTVVKAAGGFTPEADYRNVNLACILEENCMVRIPSKTEIRPDQPSGAGSNKGVEIVTDSAGAVVNEKKQEKTGAESAKINLNTATVEELDKLPRIGEKTAQEIIAYREKIGGFKKIEDLMEVPRIGEKTFAGLKDLIVVP